MKESALSAKMAKRVRTRGGWCRKVAGGPYGAGWPDLVGCYRGVMLGLEVKLPTTRNTVTDLQAATLHEMRAAGAVAVVVSSMKQLNHILDLIDDATITKVNGTTVREMTAIKAISMQARKRLEARNVRQAA